MPQNKRIIFPEPHQFTAINAQALCHPARLRIIKLLKQHRFLIRNEIVDFIPLSAPTVSQHLAALVKTRIVKRSIEFGVVGYCLDTEGWTTAKRSIKRYFAEVG